MKNVITIVCVILILASCKSFDPKLFNPTAEPSEPRLVALENNVENDLLTMVITQENPFGPTALGPNTQDIKTIFDRQVNEILTNPFGEKKGTIVLKVTTIETRIKVALYYLNVVSTLGLGSFFGMPWFGAESTVEVKIEVLDSKRTLIGFYRGSGHKKLWNGLYYNKYNRITMQRVTYVEAVKQAINEATIKLVEEVDRLNEELTK